MRIALALLLACPTPTLGAALAPDDDAPCPWCKDDPELLARLGALSHGPMPIGETTSEEIARELPSGEGWRFLETPHFRFASSLGPQSLTAKMRAELEPFLAELRAACPDLDPRPRKLDPWLRLHLLALRAEAFYERFQRLLGVTDADFPAERRIDEPYMGAGPFLGERDKFELVWHARRATHQMFTLDQMGVDVTDALRWHFGSAHKMLASIPAEDSDLRSDEWLFPHSAHLMAHLFLCAYKHFSYAPPVWLDEGLAHALERELNPVSTTIDGDEGGGPHRGDHQDWSGRDVRLAKKDDATPLAVLMHAKSFTDMSLDDHVTAWSIARFLIEEHPEGLARFLGGLKGQLDEDGNPTGANLVDLQRRLLQEIWSWTPDDLDAAWRAWLLE